jgi:hypothetical protein
MASIERRMELLAGLSAKDGASAFDRQCLGKRPAIVAAHGLWLEAWGVWQAIISVPSPA